MNEFQSYERLIRRKTEGKYIWQRIGLILAYFAFFAVWLIAALRLSFNAYLVVLAVLATVLIVLFTWRFTQVEYEYTFVSGTFYLAQIYGKRRRRAILEADLSRAILIAPYTEAYADKAEALTPEEILWAVSSRKADNIWMLVWEEEAGKRLLLFWEADERSLRILRQYNPRATAKEKLSSVSHTAP